MATRRKTVKRFAASSSTARPGMVKRWGDAALAREKGKYGAVRKKKGK